MLCCLRTLWFPLDIGSSTSLRKRSNLLGIALRMCCWLIRRKYRWGMSLSSSMLSYRRNIISGCQGSCMYTALLLCLGIVCGCNSLRTWMSNDHPMCSKLLWGIMSHNFETRHLQSSKLRPRFGTFWHIFWCLGYLDVWMHKIRVGTQPHMPMWYCLRTELYWLLR